MFKKTLEMAISPTTDKGKQALQLDMGLNYRQGIGELISPW